MRRAAPGLQVSQGRLRVDAARAIKKLREYQLVDRAAWVLEGIRAAVAAGATKISLRGDANDIWLGWHGKPWDADVLPRLFDELVSPEMTDEKQHVRLLAAAVNSALGMDPAYVDVYSITGAGTAQRARYTPEVLAEPENELGEAPLRHVAVEPHEPPTDTIMSGILVHLRRRASLQLLSYWIGEPPELPLARAACRDIAVPLELEDQKTLHRDHNKDLVRVPLEEGLDGFVAITRANVDPAACLEVAERGVVLARYDLQLLGFESKVPLPLRVFLDATRLPTNASRSQVRRDVHPIATAERRAQQVIGAAIQALVEQFGDGSGPAAKDARKAALSLLASTVGGHPVNWRYVPKSLEPLSKLPLVRNCFGQPRTILTNWVSYIHSEKAPLDEYLDQWIEEVLWAPPDDDVRILLAGYTIDVKSMRGHARWARKQRKAHVKFLAHKKRELKVQTSVFPRARVSLGVMVERSCVPQSMFEGVSGEICVYVDSRNAAVVLCVEGREVARVDLASAIPFDAVVDSKHLTPGERYRGVMRDDGYRLVDRAVRAGVVRAVETLAADSKNLAPTDLPLIRSALALVRDLELELVGPLAQAKVFKSAVGGYLSYGELDREKCIGVIAEGETIVPPPGRVIVHANGPAREELRRLFGTRVVSYHKAVHAKALDLRRIAEGLPRTGRSAVLIVRDKDLGGAIGLGTAAMSQIHVHHMGIALGKRPYNHSLRKCDIAVVSDRVVPNERWTAVADDSELAERSFRDWELALLRAIASRLVGLEVPDLVTPDEVLFDDINFTALMDVLLVHSPREILGDELVERLCQHKLFRRLGHTEVCSIRELASDGPQGIFYVDTDASPVDDFAPVIAPRRVAELIGKLGRRPVHDGKPELVRRQKLAVRKERLDALLAKPEQATVLASDMPTVAFRGQVVRGVLGLTDSLPEVRIHTETRAFMTIPLTLGYPVVAAVDLELAKCGDFLQGPSNLTIEEIADDVRAHVPDLLAAIAKEKPRLLGEPGPARRLLAQFLAAHDPPNWLRSALRSVKAFATLQSELASIAELEHPPPHLPTAAFADEWLPPGEGEPKHVHDRPILRVSRPPDELDTIFAKLHVGAISDLTTEVTRLQARRRMARGLLPTPKLTAIGDPFKRPLKQFPDILKKLGHGEVGFSFASASGASTSMLLIHEQGQLQRTLEIDVHPAIMVAVESPHEELDHAQMVRVAQDLAIELVRVALPVEVPIPLRRSLARAVLGRRIPPAIVGAVPLFARLDGTWLSWPGFQSQLDKFKDIWAVTSTPDHTEPLDPERIVIHLDAQDIDLARANGYQIINAKLELELDARTLANLTRPRARDLEIPSTEGLLGEVELDGNGQTGPRGLVAVLAPQAASRRGVLPHKAMHPFDRVDDVCRWPTIAVIDDARITPDRTWSEPKRDDIWAAITKDIRAASERALEQLGEVPGEALAEIRITNHVCSDVAALRAAPRSLIRGVLWLIALPYTPATVTYHYARGIRTFAPPKGLAIGGSVAVFTEDDLDIWQALEQLCLSCHGKLVRMAMKDKDADPDIVAAHVAHAIALETLKPAEVKGVRFDCFAPKALEPRQLGELFERTYPVPTVKRGVTDIADTAFVDDGSHLASVVRAHLGERLTKYTPKPKPKPSPPPPTMTPPVSVERPAPKPVEPPKPKPEPPKPPPKPHVLQPLVDALIARVSKLGIQSYGWVIDEDSSEILDYGKSKFVLGGRSERLRRIATELDADTILAGPAIDVLAAHAVTLLNLDRLEVTDATEMHALGVLLSSPPSAGQPRSRRSS